MIVSDDTLGFIMLVVLAVIGLPIGLVELAVVGFWLSCKVGEIVKRLKK